MQSAYDAWVKAGSFGINGGRRVFEVGMRMGMGWVVFMVLGVFFGLMG
jgi:hypothetical protein